MKIRDLLFFVAAMVLVGCNLDIYSESEEELKDIEIDLNNSTPDPYYIWVGDSTSDRGTIIQPQSKRTITQEMNVTNEVLSLTGTYPHSIIDSLKVNIARQSGSIVFSNWMHFNKPWLSDTTTIDILWYGQSLTYQ